MVFLDLESFDNDWQDIGEEIILEILQHYLHISVIRKMETSKEQKVLYA